MTATERVLAHFDRISEAPDAVGRLRRFVLDLAVRGKLVDQGPGDEPALALLGAFRKLAAQTRKGASRVADGYDVNHANSLFQLPSSWTWCRLSDVGMIVAGGTPPSKDPGNFASSGEGIPWLTPADLGRENKGYVSRGARDLSPKGLESSSATLLPKGSVLFTSRAPIGYTAIAANEISTNQGFKSVVPYLFECGRYIALYFRAFAPWIDERASGTTFREVSGKVVAGLPFPLPPLAEQHRIVAKVDELMALCDRLAAAQLERESQRDKLVSASLARLNQPADTPSFREHARFHLEHLPRMATTRAHIRQLRDTILSLAVRGRLVPQRPANELGAADLLVRLKADVDAYRLEHGLAPPKTEPVPSESPFRAPSGWEWTRLCNLFRVITDGDHLPPPKSEDGIAFLTIGNVTTGLIDFTGCRFVPQTYFDGIAPYRRPSRGDLLYTVVGATFGRPAPVNTDRHFCVQRHIAILKPSRETNVRFLSLLLGSPMIYNQAKRSLTGTAQPTIPLRPLRNFLVCVPPLEEQRRIVAKVDELTAVCDSLEQQLGAGKAAQVGLLEATLRDALTGRGGAGGDDRSNLIAQSRSVPGATVPDASTR